MPDDKGKYESLPIPTYEEAIGSSSRSAAPQNDVLYSAESEGLLSHDPGGRIPVPTRRANYRPPTVEDVDEHDTFLGQGHERVVRHGEDSEEEEDVVREMEEMEIQEPPRPLSAWSKRFSDLSHSLTRRIQIYIPNWTLPRFRIEFEFHWPVMDANFCIFLGRIFAVLLVAALVYLLFMSDLFSNAVGRMQGQMFDPESVREFVQGAVDGERIRNRAEVLAKMDHLAGTEGDFVLAKYMQGAFEGSGLQGVGLDEWQVYLNFPKDGGRRVELMDEEGKVAWSAGIEEPEMYGDPPREQTAVFHAYSREGDVEGPLIYANSGSRADFKRLYDSGIATEGAIALVRNYGSPADGALKVKAAELADFAGCIIYSDPADDGFIKGEVAPNGRYMPEGGVQRGSVGLTNMVMGDVLTPGYASTHGAKRMSTDHNPGLVNIPSIPLSWGDARHLLESLEGFGQACPDEWVGGVPDIEYWSGNLSSPRVHLVNLQDSNQKQKIWNVVGRIEGVEQKEKSIIIGARRDSFVFGATDPGSGTGVLLEVIHIFGELISRGWRPLRTIEFASWDSGQYNLIGSTEHVENDVDRLRKDAFAYINLDSAVAGNHLRAAGSPVFRKLLHRVLSRVGDPLLDSTLRDLWDQRGGFLQALGSRSDYAPFQHMAGTSSLDLRFDGPPHPTHSAYDTFEWMFDIGDPNFIYHNLLTQVVALLVLELSDRLILPFDISSFSASTNTWIHDLEAWAESKGANQEGNPEWSTEPLREATLQFAEDASAFEKWEEEWDSLVLSTGGFESPALASHRVSHNTRMANFETHLLDLSKDGGVSIVSSFVPLFLHSLFLASAHFSPLFFSFLSPFLFISFHFISFHFISFHFISFHFISFHFISFHFISFFLFFSTLILPHSHHATRTK